MATLTFRNTRELKKAGFKSTRGSLGRGLRDKRSFNSKRLRELGLRDQFDRVSTVGRGRQITSRGVITSGRSGKGLTFKQALAQRGISEKTVTKTQAPPVPKAPSDQSLLFSRSSISRPTPTQQEEAVGASLIDRGQQFTPTKREEIARASLIDRGRTAAQITRQRELSGESPIDVQRPTQGFIEPTPKRSVGVPILDQVIFEDKQTKSLDPDFLGTLETRMGETSQRFSQKAITQFKERKLIRAKVSAEIAEKIGFASVAVSTGAFLQDVITSPIQTGKDIPLGLFQIVSKPKETFQRVKTKVVADPFGSIGRFKGELVMAEIGSKGIGTIQRTARIARFKLSPEFTPVKGSKGKLAFKAPTGQKIEVKGGVSSTQEAFSTQLSRAGKIGTQVTAAKDLVKGTGTIITAGAKKKAVKGAIDLDKPIFFDPGKIGTDVGRFRSTRALGDTGSGSLAEALVGQAKVTLFRPQAQALVLREVVAPFPDALKGVISKAKAGTPLTTKEAQKLGEFQREATGEIVGPGFLGKESEVIAPAGTRIQIGETRIKTIVQGEAVEVFSGKVLRDTTPSITPALSSGALIDESVSLGRTSGRTSSRRARTTSSSPSVKTVSSAQVLGGAILAVSPRSKTDANVISSPSSDFDSGISVAPSAGPSPVSGASPVSFSPPSSPSGPSPSSPTGFSGGSPTTPGGVSVGGLSNILGTSAASGVPNLSLSVSPPSKKKKVRRRKELFDDQLLFERPIRKQKNVFKPSISGIFRGEKIKRSQVGKFNIPALTIGIRPEVV